MQSDYKATAQYGTDKVKFLVKSTTLSGALGAARKEADNIFHPAPGSKVKVTVTQKPLRG